MPASSKSTVDQTQEIERLVADVLETLDQVRYSLKTLEDRLKDQARPRPAGAQSEVNG